MEIQPNALEQYAPDKRHKYWLKSGIIVLLAGFLLVSCGTGENGMSDPTSFLKSDKSSSQDGEKEKSSKEGQSAIIALLRQRQTSIPENSAYGQIATAVSSQFASPAEAELRAAKLRAKAASKNWLPSIGPSISLSSLGDFVATLLIEQVLFDNGRKKSGTRVCSR